MTEKLKPGLLLHPVDWLALGFGSGLVPVAPGTAGTLAAIPVYLLLQGLPLEFYIPLVAGLFLVGIPICTHTARRLGVHDHPGIVWDEIAGIYLVLLVSQTSILAWALGFGLFRLFDIWKPWPIRDLDHRLGGGLGIMLDDLIAGLYTLVVIRFFMWLKPLIF